MIIKVCGMREPSNIKAVARLNIDWMGFIFYPGSKCYVPEDDVIMDTIQQCRKKKVGVFVNAPVSMILKKASGYGLDMIQLHGEETVETCKILKEVGLKVIKAFSIETIKDLEKVNAYQDTVDFYLFDTKCDGYGGSGKGFDWSVMNLYKGGTSFLLSGGISPGSISGIKQFVHPRWVGIDINSGFESEPALKDVDKIRQFTHLIND